MLYRQRKVPFVEQMEFSECGLACVAMVLGYYGHDVSLSEIRDKFGAARAGISMGQIQEIASTYHLVSRGYQPKTSQLIQLQTPCILFWENRHFVVLEKMKKNKASILDPSLGRIMISLEEVEDKFSGFALTLEPGEGFQIHKKSMNKWSFYTQIALKSRKLLGIIFIVSLLLQGLGIIVPKITQWLVDHMVSNLEQNIFSQVGITVLFIFIFYHLFQLVRGFLIAKLQSKMDMSMMSRFIRKLFKLPYDFFENRKGGDLVFRANSNVIIRRVISNRFITIMIDGLLLITYAALMVSQIWQLGVAVILLGLLMLLMIFLSSFVVQRLSRKEISAQAEMNGFLTENIYGITDIKVLGAEDRIYNNWSQLFKKQIATTERRTIWSTTFDSITSSIQYVLPLLILWLGSYYVQNHMITMGTLLGFQSLGIAFMLPIASLGMTYNELITVGSYFQRLQDVIESNEEHQGEQAPDKHFQGSIEFSQVSFRYHHFGKDILTNLNFQIHPGERVAIVGASGSGKSSLAKLILGLYAPSSGEIKIGGVAVQEWNKQKLRNSMGVILQETRLFNITIFENIALHQSEFTIDKVVHAAQLTGIHDFIMQQPLGYQTMVSENGMNFSGGQRQRILLARALMTQPKILLLDEATSSLDMISEKIITRALEECHCTQIVIAHRLSTIKYTDRIIVLDQGCMIESGTHQELMNLRGKYYELYTSQENSFASNQMLTEIGGL